MSEKKSASVYDFSYFETPAKVEPAQKTEEKAKVTYLHEEKRATEYSFFSSTFKKIIICVVVGMAMIACIVAMRSKCDTLNSQIEKANKVLDISKSENVRLNAELNSMISVEKIEDYAENVLGMTKIESYQITYIDLSEGDEVVVSGGKSVENPDSVANKLRELFAYFF